VKFLLFRLTLGKTQNCIKFVLLQFRAVKYYLSIYENIFMMSLDHYTVQSCCARES